MIDLGPYDPKLPGSVSVINWFYLDSDRIVPKRLTYDIQEDNGITGKESDRMVKPFFPFFLFASGEERNLVIFFFRPMVWVWVGLAWLWLGLHHFS